MSVSSPFIKRPVGTSLLTIGLLLAGILAFQFLPVAPLPQVEFPVIQVGASLPGASPETMASAVATPLERQFGRIAGINQMTSTSQIGSTGIVLQFDLNRNIDAAGRDVQAAINAARSNLPSYLPGNPSYRKVNPADAPVLIVSLTSDTYTLPQMYDAADSVLAQKLGLLKSKETEDDYQASPKVRDWLNSSNHSFLLIFDNVDKIDMLLQVWPASTKGSILITTRSPSVAAKRSNEIMHLEPFTAQLGPEALYALTGFTGADNEDTAAAEEICRLLGGLPLAIVQVSEFIRDRASSYTEFLALYQKSSAKILARGEVPLEYNHTLSTVWELSSHNLPPDASTLQKLIAFLDPDAIEERLLTNTHARLSDERLEF